MDIITIIPARSGSKGLPDKNIRLLAEKPLIAFSIMAAKKSKLIDRVIVSTDSKKYAAVAKEYGAEVPFYRPKKIAVDDSTDFEFIKHAIDWLNYNENYQPDFVINLRPVTPLRDPSLIDEAIKTLINSPESTSLRSVHEMPETAYKMCEVEKGFLKTICHGSFDHDSANMPRQAFPKTFTPNGYIDVMRTQFIYKNNLLYGNRVKAFITPISYEVDTIDDFHLLEWLVNKDNKYFKILYG